MAQTVIITVSNIGPSVGPFNIYSINSLGVVAGPFETNITRAQLLNGFVSISVPDDCVTIRVTSLSVECPVSLDITLNVITTTTTSSTTTSTTTSAPFGLGRCVPLYVTPLGNIYAYDFTNNTSTEINLGYLWKTNLLAHTGNKLWMYDGINDNLIQYDIVLSPFSYTPPTIINLTSVLLYGPLDDGLTAFSDTILIGTAPVNILTPSGNALVYAIVEIVLDPLNINSPAINYTSVILGYTINSIGTVFPRTIVGDFIITTTSKLIGLTTGYVETSPGVGYVAYYLNQWNYSGISSSVEVDVEIFVPECTGVFQNGTDIYVATRTGDIYLVNKITFDLTYVKSLTLLVDTNIVTAMSQIPSCVTESLVPTGTVRPPVPPSAVYTYTMYDCVGNTYTIFTSVPSDLLNVGSKLYLDEALTIFAPFGSYGLSQFDFTQMFNIIEDNGEIVSIQPCLF